MSLQKLGWFGMVCAVSLPFSGVVKADEAGDAPSEAAQSDDIGKLQEVVVTAERRVSAVQKTADSISVRSGADMLAQGRYSLSQILEDVPGVSGGAATQTGGSAGSGTDATAAGLTIRGIASNSGAGGSITSVAPAAAIYVDGVYEGVGGSYDLDRVEVLRGPQGTLYGRSATSGVVAIHTANPNLEQLGGNVALEFGNYDLQHYTAAVNLPIIDDVLGIRIAGNRYSRAGYYFTDGGAVATTDGRLKLLYKPNEDVSLQLGYALENNTTHTGGTITLSAPNTFDFTTTQVGPGNNQYREYYAILDADLGFASLTYQPAFRSWNSADANYLRYALLNLNQTISTPKDNFLTHELRFTSKPNSKLIWQAGALYYDNDLSNDNIEFFEPSGALALHSITAEKTTRAAGAFGEATYPFMDTWRLTTGVRYDWTKVSVNQIYTSLTLATQTLGGDAGIRQFHNVTYKARIEHDFTPENLGYASISSGFSPGDVSVTTGVTGNPVLLELQAETLTAYELGSKNRFLSDTLQVNGDVYYYRYTGFQTAGINVTPDNPGNPTFSTLAAPAQVLGGELEILYQLTALDRVGVDLSYTDAYWVDKNGSRIPTGTGSYVLFSQFFARDKIPNVVPLTASLAYDHAVPLPGGSTLSLHGDVRWLSAYDTTNVGQQQLDAGAFPFMRSPHEVVGDLNAIWSSSNDRYSVTAYMRNVGDNRYKTGVSISGGGPAPLNVLATPYDPRTYGVVLSARF